jgi:LacI family transcriptional regulator
MGNSIMKNASRTRILVQVDLGQKADRDLLGGVLRYAALHPAWDVRILSGHPMTRIPGILRDWKPEGIITDRLLKRDVVSHMAGSGLKGVIALYGDATRDVRVHGVAFRHVACDNHLIGEAGAQFLLAKRLRHFAYVPAIAADEPLDRRRHGFVERIEARGFDVSVFPVTRPRRGRFPSDEERLAQWLADLPKPCGIMAAFDQRAKNVLDACRLAQVDAPAQVMILGVDNEEYICENTVPSLSSILPDFNGGGFMVAEALQRIIDGENGDKPPLLYGIKQIVERASTVDVGGTARSVALACEYMRRNAASPIGIDDIVAASGTSRRLLEKHFRSVMDTTIGQELRRMRLELVKQRLEETDIPLGQVGEGCGFRDEFHLKKLFKRTFGMTMSAYRRTAKRESARRSRDG